MKYFLIFILSLSSLSIWAEGYGEIRGFDCNKIDLSDRTFSEDDRGEETQETQQEAGSVISG